MGKEVNRNIPILFQKLDNEEFISTDTRFQKVKIWLMHLEENFNGSYFSREVVEAAIPTLANTPILAFIEKDRNGEIDFSDHRMEVKRENGEVKVNYLGKPIGVIPADNNAKFEERLCDDGVTRTFLTVEGLLWTKIDDATDIMNRDVIKSQSMELHSDYEGRFKEDGLFHFTKFSFYGACGLGDGVQPAMMNSTIELQFSFDDFKAEVNQRLEEFKKYYTSLHEDSLNEANTGLFKKEDDVVNKVKTKEEIATSFNLTASQLEEELRRALSKKTYLEKNWYDEEYETAKYYLKDYDENFVYAVDREEGYIDVKIPYTLNGDNVVFDFKNVSRIKYVPVDWDEGESEEVFENFTLKIIEEKKLEFNKLISDKKKIEADLAEKADALLELNNRFEVLKAEMEKKDQEINSLKEFKKNAEMAERKSKVSALFEKYEEYLSKEDIDSLLEKEPTFANYEEFEKEVKLTVADKVIEKVAKDGQSTSFSKMGIPSNTDEEQTPLSVWDRLANKKDSK